MDAGGTSFAPSSGEVATMDTFFVRKQLVVGALFLVFLETCVMLVRMVAR